MRAQAFFHVCIGGRGRGPGAERGEGASGVLRSVIQNLLFQSPGVGITFQIQPESFICVC